MSQSVLTIDTHYLGRPQAAAAFLIVEGDRAAFVENNTGHAVPLLLEALRQAGLSPEQVDYAIVTHAHLDHAAGSSALLKACPNASLLAHPRAARHLIDPSRLVASARAVYGAQRFGELYGEIEPIPAERVRSMEDGERLQFGSRELFFFHTRGHANHHLCIHDSGSDGVFTGDAFGLVYPALQGSGLFAFPTTSPTDYLPDEALAAVRQIAARRPQRVFLTHFGESADVAGIAGQLESELAFSAQLFAQARDSGLTGKELERLCRDALDSHFGQRLRERGLPDSKEVWEVLAMDLELNAQGIAWAAQRVRQV
ncbi:MAG: MBL fold metallo-hydrolase [Myxococcota bacterium]|nr:MBL fold metallo-hydrolase [Myxococcota bacterium]